MLAEIAAMDGPRQVLYELHRVAVRILHLEAPVAVRIFVHLGRHLDALAGQISAQPAGIVSFEADPDEPVLRFALQRRRNFHVLTIVDLEACRSEEHTSE